MEILGVRIDNLTKKEILEKIEFFLSEDKFHQIATVNPEFILKAQNDIGFENILNNSDLNIADGVGIWYAFIRNYNFLKCRFSGVDLTEYILNTANEKRLNVYLAINKAGLSNFSEIKKTLERKYPNIYFSGKNFYNTDTSQEIRNSKYDILFCNFGAPHQERFINSQKNGRIRLAMGIGGTFDIMTGKVKRAPKIVRILGLEWLWRMFFHSYSDRRFIYKRLKRIFRAVVIFPVRVTVKK